MEKAKLRVIDVATASPEALRECEPYIDAAIRHSLGEHSLSDIMEAISTGQIIPWMVVGEDERDVLCCFGCEIVQYPQFKAMVVRFLGGKEIERWADVIQDIERWAVEEGCVVIEAVGRKGFKPFASRFGFTEVYRVYSKTLTPGKAN